MSISKGKLKKFTALVLCCATLLFAVPSGANAAKPRVSGVDYSRLWNPGGAPYTVEANIGKKSFAGVLERERALTDDEVDDILRQCLRFLNMTEGTLLACNNAVERAKKELGFTTKDAIEILLGLTGADNIVDLFGLVTGWGNKSAGMIALDIGASSAAGHGVKAAAELAGGKLAVKAATTLGGYAISVLVNAGKVSIQQYEKWKEHQRVIEDALEAERKLHLFYTVANNKLRNADEAKGGKWRLRIDKKQTLLNVSFFAIRGNTQTWHLWCDLVKENTSTVRDSDPTGVYTGKFGIEVVHTLAAFDKAFFDRMGMNSTYMRNFTDITEALAARLASESGLIYSPPFYSFYAQDYGATDLSVLYYLEDFELNISLDPDRMNTKKYDFRLSDMVRTPTFEVAHNIVCLPEANVFTQGKIDVPNYSASMEVIIGFKGDWAADSIPMIGADRVSGNMFATSFGQGTSASFEYEYNPSEYSKVDEDPEILRDLRGATYFLITGGGRPR